MPRRKPRDPYRHAQIAPVKRPPSREERDAPPAVEGEYCRCGDVQHNGPCPVRSCGCRYNRPIGGGDAP
jgi:hypothetical protein